MLAEPGRAPNEPVVPFVESVDPHPARMAILEGELFALLEHTADAAYAVDAAGQIRAWNAAARRLFGHTFEDVVGRNVDEVLHARDAFDTAALAGGMDAAARSPDAEDILAFDIEVRRKSGEPLWINVSTIVFDNPRSRERLFIRLARDVSERREREARASRLVDAARQVVTAAEAADAGAPVHELTRQELRILRLFGRGQSAAAIARALRISPHTLRNHLHHINRKLRTRDRLAAVTHARRRGLID